MTDHLTEARALLSSASVALEHILSRPTTMERDSHLLANHTQMRAALIGAWREITLAALAVRKDRKS